MKGNPVTQVRTGLDRLLDNPEKYLKPGPVGLLVNHTSVAGDGRHSIVHFKTLDRHPLRGLFAPEHGLYGVDQDMIAVSDAVDPVSGLTIQSLYGAEADTLAPSPDGLAGLGNLVFDIQDIGSRYYTFIYTLANCMAACREAGVRVVVLDRPNPIGGVQVEGNRVDEACRSFVGQYPLLNRHGMTVGELAGMFNDAFGIGCDLEVVPMQGWQRAMGYEQTGLMWVPPSPNMPALSTAAVYPGMCLIEGTQLSEGRGTTLPFEQIGASYIDPHRLAARLAGDNLPGVFCRPHFFKPMFHKDSGNVCGGVQFHITDRKRFKPLLTGIAVIRAIYDEYPETFAWRSEPYEFVSDRPAIDLLYGNPDLRTKLLPNGASLDEIEASWQPDREAFLKLRGQYLLY